MFTSEISGNFTSFIIFVGSMNKNGGVSDIAYSLVGQTLFQPKELRLHQINLTIDQFIAIEPGDVLGFYAPEYNPLPWTSVPCADARQRPLVAAQPTIPGRPVVVGRRMSFVTVPPPTNGAPLSSCRQYSFSALLGSFHPFSGLCYYKYVGLHPCRRTNAVVLHGVNR